MHRLVRMIRQNLVAWVALFFALAGTGMAASGYVITSSRQISPAARTELRHESAVLASKGSMKGAKAVVARLRITEPVTANPPEQITVPLGQWTQQATEDDVLIGQATTTADLQAGECASSGVWLSLDGNTTHVVGWAVTELKASETVTKPLLWEAPIEERSQGLSLPIFEPGATTVHKLTVLLEKIEGCAGNFTVTVAVDVIAAR